jgi:hypothetical protein
MLQYCPRLELPEVQSERRRYAERDRVTPTERWIEKLIAEGELEDPQRYSIERVCAAGATEADAGSGSGHGEQGGE